MEIINDGERSVHDPRRGDYQIRLMRRGTTDVVQRSGDVKNHPRLSASVWILVAKALKAVSIRGGE